MCGTACAPSTSTVAPAAFAFATSAATGLTVPSELLTWMIATILVRGVSRRSNASRSSSPRSVIGAAFSVAPVWAHTSCHGTIFEWCSIHVTSTSSPGFKFVRPQLWATRLMPSVQPFVKTISRRSAALMNRATDDRVAS